MSYSLVYITAKNMNEARKISNALLKEKLAACTNMTKIESSYWWKGKIAKSKEVLIIAKTKTELVDELIKNVKAIHSYTVPCIISLPIEKGNENYLKWIGDVTK